MKKLCLILLLFCFAPYLGYSQTTIQLGGGGNFNSFDMPVCNLGNYSYTQQLYTATEIQNALTESID
jgi:hypothetical protein